MDFLPVLPIPSQYHIRIKRYCVYLIMYDWELGLEATNSAF